MFTLYSIALSAAFVLMLPLFILRRDKYASGFRERLGRYPEFADDGRPVVWLHCVSVGEANAARPLVARFADAFPGRRLIVSTTTKTGQDLARDIFRDTADAIFYFPFDWNFSVRRALSHFRPAAVLLMETEIWPNFIREAKTTGARVAIVNGRLSESSYDKYSYVAAFVRRVLSYVDLALMQGERDADRIAALGVDPARVRVAGNMKFDHDISAAESEFTAAFRGRFAVTDERPLIAAASTHDPEEKWVLSAYASAVNDTPAPHPRLLIAPRHPERFDRVAELVEEYRDRPDAEWSDYTFVRRSEPASATDRDADVILLDSIGELRAVYPLARIVFVGGSLIPHGGQSVLEPAAAGAAVITGPHTHNFEEVVLNLLERRALIQLPASDEEYLTVDGLYDVFVDLLTKPGRRSRLGENALAVMRANRGATERTIRELGVILPARPE